MPTFINLGNGNNTITPTPADADYIITGGDGNNTVTLGNGTDQFTLGNGSNTLTVGNGADQFTLGSGNNTVTTGNGNSTIAVGDGNNTVTVGTGSNQITLGDALNAGTDTVHTGAGNNTVSISAAVVSASTIMGAMSSLDGTTNQLVLTTAGTMSPVNVSGFGTYQLASGGPNNLTLSAGNFARLPGGTITVVGGNSGNTINAAALSAAAAVILDAGAGVDVLIGGAGNDRFVFKPSDPTGDSANGGTGNNTLELATGAGTGILSGLGTSFVNLQTIKVDANASWQFSATNNPANEAILLGSNSTAEFQGALSSSNTVSFTANTGLLKIDQPSLFAAAIVGFSQGDTIDDAVIANSYTYSGGVLTLNNNGAMVAQLTVATPYANPQFTLASDNNGGTLIGVASGNQVNPVPSDFNGDGTSDLLWQQDTGQAAIWLMNGDAVQAAALVGDNPGTSWQLVGTGDFNGDGKSDLLWQQNTGQAAIWEMNGTDVQTKALAGDNPGTSWQLVGTGDFNGDGKSDLLWQQNTGQAAIWEMNGTDVQTKVLAGDNPGTSWQLVGTGDFNDDGKSDLLWQQNTGQAAIWEMNGTDVQTKALAGDNPGTSWQLVGTGDFNGDGKSDLLWQNVDGTPAIWLMNATAPISQVALPNPGPAWHLAGAGDYNGDGKSDLLWQQNTGQAAVWEMNGTAIQSSLLVGTNPGTSWHLLGG